MADGGTLLIILWVVVIAGGVLLLRAGWGHAARGRTAAGWALIVVGFGLLAAGDGAWGLIVGALAVMAAAFLLLAQAILVSPPEKARAMRAPRPTVLLRSGSAFGLARRIGTFLLVVPTALAVSVLAGVALQAAARAGGWAEADSVALGLLAFPIVWTILVTWLMARSGPVAMLKPLAGTALASGVLFWLAL